MSHEWTLYRRMLAIMLSQRLQNNVRITLAQRRRRIHLFAIKFQRHDVPAMGKCANIHGIMKPEGRILYLGVLHINFIIFHELPYHTSYDVMAKHRKPKTMMSCLFSSNKQIPAK